MKKLSHCVTPVIHSSESGWGLGGACYAIVLQKVEKFRSGLHRLHFRSFAAQKNLVRHIQANWLFCAAFLLFH